MKNKDKYIPKVGEECEVYHSGVKQTVFYHGETQHKNCYICEHKTTGSVYVVIDAIFSAIQTKADIEREQLIDIIYKYTGECKAHSCSTADLIQNAGFTIPKKVKRSDVSALISDWTDLPNVLTSEVCNLLGDLVEQDQ